MNSAELKELKHLTESLVPQLERMDKAFQDFITDYQEIRRHFAVQTVIGRPTLAIPVKNILNALGDSSTVNEAAGKLPCSRSHIYYVLKPLGIDPTAMLRLEKKDNGNRN